MKPAPKYLGWLMAGVLLPVSAAAKAAVPAAGADTSNAAVWLAVYVLAALVFSFLCSVAEAVLLSITPSYIEGLKEKQPVMAGRLKRLKQDNVDRSLSAILTLNTIADFDLNLDKQKRSGIIMVTRGCSHATVH